MIERVCSVVETTVLGVWAGAMAGFAFLFAPAAFRIVTNTDTFATLIAKSIGNVGTFGVGCGAAAIACALMRATRRTARTAAFVRIVLVSSALAAGAYETGSVIPRMQATAAQIPGPLDSVPKTDPRRTAYDAQHRTSSRVYGVALLCVLAAAAFSSFRRDASA